MRALCYALTLCLGSCYSVDWRELPDELPREWKSRTVFDGQAAFVLATSESSARLAYREIEDLAAAVLELHGSPLEKGLVIAVEFDDPAWNKYMNYLKPLGLGILLNTCNISTEEKYTNFFNHLNCEAIRVEEETAAELRGENDGGGNAGNPLQQEKFKRHLYNQTAGIDMLPIVTRGCLCELANKIGFSRHTTLQYSLASQIQTFRHVQPNQRDKFLRNLSVARLKFPFPHLVSVLVQHRTTGARQLISQVTKQVHKIE